MHRNGFTLKLATSVLAGLMFSGMAWGENAQKANPRFVPEDDTVYDKTSHLTWARCNVGQRWKEAVGCEGKVETFTFDDARKLRRGGWRVPTKNELSTLINETGSKQMPTTDQQKFQDMNLENQTYWTSTPSSVGDDWGIYFDGNKFLNGKRNLAIAVRLVRDRNKP
jgi:hypothetical protein